MRVTIAIDSHLRNCTARDLCHRAEVYPTGEYRAAPLMTTGWDDSAAIARRQAYQWALMQGHEVANPPPTQ
jgi:hypothetical protein